MSAEHTAALDDDIYVKREVIMALFDPPLKPSSFHFRADKGDFVGCKGLRGYYALNATRKKLGLAPVDIHAYRAARQEASTEQQARQVAFAALSIVIPEVLAVFTMEETPESLTPAGVEEVGALAIRYAQELKAAEMTDSAERLAFAGGVLAALNPS